LERVMRTHVLSFFLRGLCVITAGSAVLAGAAGYTQAWAAGTAALPPAATLPLTATLIGPITGLTPGGAPQAINYTIKNLNTSPLYAKTVTIATSGVRYVKAAGSGVGTTFVNHPAGGAAPGCPAANFAIVAPDPLQQNLAPGDTPFTRLSTKKGGTIAMVETGRNQNDCQGTMAALTLTVA
jgi:hypothetical protein